MCDSMCTCQSSLLNDAVKCVLYQINEDTNLTNPIISVFSMQGNAPSSVHLDASSGDEVFIMCRS